MIVFSGLLTSIFIGLTDDRKISELKSTSQELKELKSLVLDFYAKNGRYPCPAAIERSDIKDFGKEAFNPATGFCDTSRLLSVDADGKAQYAGGQAVPVTEDFVGGIFPFASLGLKSDSAKGTKKDYYLYAVSHLLTKKNPCDRFLALDGSIEKMPTSFKIMTDWDFKITTVENQTKNVDPAINANFVIISFGNDSGGFSENGERILPPSMKGRYINYSDMLDANRKFTKQGQFDEFFLIPSNPLKTPRAAVNEEIKATDYEDIAVYGSSNSIITKICVLCRGCNATSSNMVAAVDSYSSCGDIEQACKCTSDASCDQSAGECCNEGTGQCGKQCSIACNSNADCSLGNCCGDSSGGKKCDALFCKSAPRCEDNSECPNGECCNISLKECNASYCIGFPNCCGTDPCCDAKCTGYNLCSCHPSDQSCQSGCNDICDPKCANYDKCACNPSDPSCTSICNDICDPKCPNYDKCACNPSDPSCSLDCSDSCNSPDCPGYDTCNCNPSDPICASCTVDADCDSGKCCVNNSCTTCDDIYSTCKTSNECAANQACCNRICVDNSSIINGKCPDTSCNPITNPCPRGYACCSGFCEEMKIYTFGKTDGIALVLGKGGGIYKGGKTTISSSDELNSGGGPRGESHDSGIQKQISASDLCNTCQNRADCGGNYCCDGICSNTPCQTSCTSNHECTDSSLPYCCGGACQAAPCSCTSNAQCSGATPNCCSGTGICQAAPCSCTSDAQCPTGMNCCNGTCSSAACTCNDSTPCGPGKNCCNGTCQTQSCCVNNSQCPIGQCCNSVNGQCNASYCTPSCCSTDSCCSQQCPGYNPTACGCQQDQCSSTLCPDYNFCTCNPQAASCNTPDCSNSCNSPQCPGYNFCVCNPADSSCSTTPSCTSSCDNPQCSGYDFCTCNPEDSSCSTPDEDNSGGLTCNTYIVQCGPNGCNPNIPACASSGCIQWTNWTSGNTTGPYAPNMPAALLASGTTSGMMWEFRHIGWMGGQFGGSQPIGGGVCNLYPVCKFSILNSCDIITTNNPAVGNYEFFVPCLFSVNYSGANIGAVNFDLNSLGAQELCSASFSYRTTSSSPYIWHTINNGPYPPYGVPDSFCRTSIGNPYLGCPMDNQ